MSRVAPDPPDLMATTVVPGRLFALGGSIPLSERVSWRPPSATGWQPVNAYVLLGDDAALVVETGVAAHRQLILRQLESVLPRHRSLFLFCTRADYECIGNLGAIHKQFGFSRVYTGGEGRSILGPFNWLQAFDGTNIPMERIPPGGSVDLGGGVRFEVIAPLIRLMDTYWVYEHATRTLFTSDVFGSTDLPVPAGSRLSSGQADEERLRRYTLQKFNWLADAHTAPIRTQLDELFTVRQVERIAPTHGCIIEGHEAVMSHYRALQSILAERK